MGRMFYYASAFNQAVGNWDTSKVQYMHQMFYAASLFNQAMGSWDTSQVTDMYQMFYAASSFNQDLCQWRLSPFPYTSATNIFLSSGCTNKNAPVSSTQQNWCAATTCS